MATLLLTAVGSAVAGPIGAAIGAMAGQRIDQALLGPKGRQGARLANLSVQASTYGASIPRIFGRMRVAGTVIWATDLREERSKVSQGKGRPKATIYSYSASFAVLLSGRPAARVGRIWADGKLLRGAAGDFKVETGFRFYTGQDDQPLDPLIAAAEGVAAPAYRGRSYAVFEDLALESYGNRIPMLSFELIAEEGLVDAGDIVADLAGPGVAAQGGPALDGFAADGVSVAAAITSLEAVAPANWVEGEAGLRRGGADAGPIHVARSDLGAGSGLQGAVDASVKRKAVSDVPSRVELTYADPDRDFQQGVQTIDFHGSGQAEQWDVPAALGPAAASVLARDRLFMARQERAIMEVRLPWRYLDGWQSMSFVIEDTPWRLRSIRFEGMTLICAVSPVGVLPATDMPVDGGRGVDQPDLEAGPTILQLVELPGMGEAASWAPVVALAAAGSRSGWRSAVLMQRNGETAPWEAIGSTAAPATMGEAMDALLAASSHLFDLHNAVTVRLLHEDMALLNADDSALAAGANLARLGSELFQFGRAVRSGPSTWQLSRLLRGRRATEAGMSTHVPGEPFLVLDPDTLLALSVQPGAPMVDVMAKGVGDPQGVISRIPVTGRALAPLCPVHLRAAGRPDGGMTLSWVRRSREGWRWLDGVDVPLGEEAELYRVEIANEAHIARFNLAVPALELDAATMAALRQGGAPTAHVAITQVGRFAVSEAADLVLAL